MGVSLVLAVEDEDQTEETIRAYYQYALEKERALREDEYDQGVNDWYKYEDSRDRLQEKGLFHVSEQLFRDVSVEIGWDNLEELFDPAETDQDYVITDPEDIVQLVELLRDAKRTLQDEKPDVNWNLTLELETIALCEFALEHGYGIELSF